MPETSAYISHSILKGKSGKGGLRTLQPEFPGKRSWWPFRPKPCWYLIVWEPENGKQLMCTSCCLVGTGVWHQTGKNESRTFSLRCKNSYLWNACVVMFSLLYFVGYNFPSSPHYYPQKKKKRENNSILESHSAKVKIKNGQKYSSKACIIMTNMIFKVEIGSMWWGLELWENLFVFLAKSQL